MRFFAAAAALALAGSVSAHTHVFTVWVNGVDQGDGRKTYIRAPPNNNPVKDLTSPALVCNVNGRQTTTDFVSAAAGDTLTFEWFHDNRGDDIIATSHKGPVITYIAPYTEADGTGPIWSKIAEAGLDGTTWAVDTLIKNKGKQDFKLPASLAAGKYLIRQEVIGLHEADADFTKNPVRGAQFYPSCVQFDITGSGSATPDQNFDFNTGYKESDPGILFNLYGQITGYQIPGPQLWSAAGGGAGTPRPPVSSPTPTGGNTPKPTGGAGSPKPPGGSPTTFTTAVKPSATPGSGAGGNGVGTVAHWSQCGGKEYNGPTACVSPFTCQELNPYYFQCL